LKSPAMIKLPDKIMRDSKKSRKLFKEKRNGQFMFLGRRKSIYGNQTEMSRTRVNLKMKMFKRYKSLRNSFWHDILSLLWHSGHHHLE
jgi:hypothetical protein